MAIFGVFLMQFFESEDPEWAKGLAIATKNWTQETANQSVVVAPGTAKTAQSYCFVQEIVDGVPAGDVLAAWHIGLDGQVKEGMPDGSGGPPVDPDPPIYPPWEYWNNDPAKLYKVGDRVSHNGKNWESLVPNNHWEPGAPGSETVWKEI